MICSASQIDSFWNTLVLSNDCESSMRAIVIEPPCCGVEALEPLPPASAAAAAPAAATAANARNRTGLRAFTVTPSQRGRLWCSVYNTQHRSRYANARPPAPARIRRGTTPSGGAQAPVPDGRRLAGGADHLRRRGPRGAADRDEAGQVGRCEPLAGARGAADPAERGARRPRPALRGAGRTHRDRRRRGAVRVPDAARAGLDPSRRRGAHRRRNRRARHQAEADGAGGRRARSATLPRREHHLLQDTAPSLPERDAARARRPDLEEVGALLEHLRAAAAVRADVADPAPGAAQRRSCPRRPDRRAGRPADPRARAAHDRRDLRAPVSEYVVVGAGAIGGTVGAQLARGGHSVLFCDADPEHVAAINARGLTIEGPVEAFTVEARAVSPDELPDTLGAVLLAVKSQHTESALAAVAPRLAAD